MISCSVNNTSLVSSSLLESPSNWWKAMRWSQLAAQSHQISASQVPSLTKVSETSLKPHLGRLESHRITYSCEEECSRNPMECRIPAHSNVSSGNNYFFSSGR